MSAAFKAGMAALVGVLALVLLASSVTRSAVLSDVSLACHEQGWYVIQKADEDHEGGRMIFCVTVSSQELLHMENDADLPMYPKAHTISMPSPWPDPEDFSDSGVGCIDDCLGDPPCPDTEYRCVISEQEPVPKDCSEVCTVTYDGEGLPDDWYIWVPDPTCVYNKGSLPKCA
jgi:hypothetical protein